MPCNRKKVSEILVVLAPIPISRPRVKHSALNAHTTQDLLCDSRFSHTIMTGWLGQLNMAFRSGFGSRLLQPGQLGCSFPSFLSLG